MYFNRTSRKFHGLDDQMMTQLRETYPKVDVTHEINKMTLWLLSDRGSKRKGSMGFIVTWLNNSSPSSGIAAPILDHTEPASPLSHLVRDYLVDLWKDQDHILEFNTIRTSI